MSNKQASSKSQAQIFASSLLILAFIGGCGTGPAGETATGLVTIGGKSATNAEVTLWLTSEVPHTAVLMTRTDETGRFKIVREANVAAGEYTVTCNKFVKPSGADLGPDDKPDEVDAKSIVPVRYQKSDSSPIKIEVPAEELSISISNR